MSGRIVVGVITLIGSAWSYTQMIRPLHQRESALWQEVAALQQRSDDVRKEMSQIKENEQEAMRLRGNLNSLFDDVPLGPAISWFPGRLKTQLSGFGVTKAEIRQNTAVQIPGLPGFEWTFWHVQLPRQGGIRKVSDILLAIAQIEQQDRFVKVVDLTVRADQQEALWVAGNVNVAAFVRK